MDTQILQELSVADLKHQSVVITTSFDATGNADMMLVKTDRNGRVQ